MEDHGIREFTLHPSDFGLPTHPLEDVKGGTPAHNAEVFVRLLNVDASVSVSSTTSTITSASDQAILDFVLLNASALLVAAGLANNFREGVELARKSVQSGRAWDAFVRFRDGGRDAV